MIQDVLKRLIHGEKNATIAREDGDDESESIDLNNIIQIVNDYQHLQFDQLLIELFYKLIDNNSNELIVELINSGVLNGEMILKEMVGKSILRQVLLLLNLHLLLYSIDCSITIHNLWTTKFILLP